jgi:hypothetical protein
MKTNMRVVTVIGLLLLVAGCKPSHRVDFKPALVSIDPGDGWKRLDIPAALPACSPRLVGKAGMINALLLEDFTEIKKAADFMQARFASNSKVVADSFKQEDFTSESGLIGIHLSYTAASKNSATPNDRSHRFITHNRKGQCVSVSYITSPAAEATEVLQAISKTLRVE